MVLTEQSSMCYGTSHLRTAHPIRGQQLVSRIIIVKVRKRKDHGITPWKRCSHKKGGSVKGAGPLFLSLLSFPGTGMLDKPIPEAGEIRGESGIPVPSRRLGAFPRVVPRKLAPARELSIQMCPSKMIRLRPRGGEDGGRGGRIGEGARMPQDGLSSLSGPRRRQNAYGARPLPVQVRKVVIIKRLLPNGSTFGENVAEKPKTA